MTKALQETWRSGQISARPVSAETLREQAKSFSTLIARRNLREYAATALIVPVFVFFALTAETRLEAIGHGTIILGALLVALLIWRLAGSEAGPETLGQPVIQRHRTQLMRQRDALRWVPVWYLGPLIPGFAVLAANDVIQANAKGDRVVAALIPTLIVLIVFAAIWWLNARAAKMLDGELRDLDAVIAD